MQVKSMELRTTVSRWLLAARRRAKQNETVRRLEYNLGGLAARVTLVRSSGRKSARRAQHVPTYFLAAMVRVKDETRFLPEWVAYHLRLGFDHVYIYDNGSVISPLETLEPWVKQGKVTVIDWQVRPVSPSADHHFLDKYGSHCRWVAFLDADEFLVVRESSDTLHSILMSVTAPALAVRWRAFGSSWHEFVPAGLLLRNFRWSDKCLNAHVKVIARPSEIIAYRNPHNFYYRGFRLARAIDGSPVFGSLGSSDCGPDRVEISHYVYRSRADYSAKVSRGYADLRGAKDRARNESRIAIEFGRHNEEQAVVSDEVLEKVARDLASLGFPSELFESHE